MTPLLMEWRFGGSMEMGGETLESRLSTGCEGGRTAALAEPDALAAVEVVPGTDDSGNAGDEMREDTRDAGRENWTAIDNLPPSVSTGPPKS